MLKTLVTGGTGFLGSEIVKRLNAQSESVRILSRDPAKIPAARRTPGTEYFRGDVLDPASLAAAMQGCDAVVNAVQFENAPFENPRRGLTYERIDGEGTERQVEAAKSAGVKRFIYMSGAGVAEGLTEPWFRAKARAEKAVRESGMNWTIFRPSWVFGPEDRSLNRFASMARISPFVFLVGSGKQRVQPVFVEDVARFVHRALNEPRSYGQLLELGGPEELEMRELIRRLLVVMRKKRMCVTVPVAVMRALASFLELLPSPPLTCSGIDFLTMEPRVDSSKACQMLGLETTRLEMALGQHLRR